VNSRRTFAALVLALLAVTVSFLAPPGVASVVGVPVAAADPVEDKKNEVKQLADKLDEIELQAAMLTEDYNDAVLRQQQLQGEIDAATIRVSEAEAEAERNRLKLKEFAVDAYVRGGTEVAVPSPLQLDLNTSAKVGQYADAAVGDPVRLIKQFKTAKSEAEKQIKELDKAKAEADEVSKTADTKLAETKAAVDEQQKTLDKVEGELGLLLASERNRRGGGVTTGPSGGGPVPPPGQGAGSAIEAAKSQIGVPWRWAASTPGVAFDCSGLVMWAWGRGGKSLPHSSRSMYAMSRKISRSELQPGDLVFYGRPSIHHVALYIGGGQIIHSPGAGKRVHITTVDYWDEYAGAGRI
jgi:cell wall-associated NlpC family hydrolase